MKLTTDATLASVAAKAKEMGWTENDLAEALSLREETADDGIIALDRKPETQEKAEKVSRFLATAEALGAKAYYYAGHHEMALDILDIKFCHPALDGEYTVIDSATVDKMAETISTMMADNFRFRATPKFVTRIKAAIAAYYGVAGQLCNLAI